MCAFWTKKKSSARQNGSEAEHIRCLLEDALGQRSKVDICFSECVTTIRSVDSYIVRISAEDIVLCVSLVNIEPEKFAGASLKCSFRVSDGKSSKHKKLFEFESRVISVQTTKSGEIHFALALPEKILTAQQRRCVRVTIDKKRIPLVSVWHELPDGQRVSGSQPLAISNNDDSYPMRLCNLSTAGLCLRVKKSELHGKFSEIQQGDSFTFYFEAVRDGGEGEQPFWVNAVLRNVMHVLEAGDALFGFEFVAEGEVDEDGRLKWESLRTGELASLGAFIFKWNVLDFQKEKSCSP